MYMFPNTRKEDLYNALTFHDLESDPTGNTFEEFASAGTLNMRMSYSLPAVRTGHKVMIGFVST